MLITSANRSAAPRSRSTARDYSHYVGDATKMATAMIASVDQQPAPRRLVLGSDAYGCIHEALRERVAEVEAQAQSAAATDAAPVDLNRVSGSNRTFDRFTEIWPSD